MYSVDTPARLMSKHGNKQIKFTLAEPLRAELPDRLRALGASIFEVLHPLIQIGLFLGQLLLLGDQSPLVGVSSVPTHSLAR